MALVPYREAVGSLMFLLHTRPDISYEVSRVSMFAENPGHDHWSAVKGIFRYLQGTKDLCITYGLDPQHPHDQSYNRFDPYAFCDSDWAGDQDSRRSTFGYVFLVNGGPVTWATRVQKSVANSVTEAEYVALSETAKEAVWIRRFLDEVGYPSSSPTSIKSDNQGAIAITKNPEFHQRTKHIDVRYHFVREQQSSGQIKVGYTPTTEQPADMLTKSLTSPSLIRCRTMLNLKTATGERRC